MPIDKNAVYHFYWILVKNRKEFRKKLRDAGIETGIHYKPVHMMTMYKNNVKLPVTEQVSQEIVTIPTHPNLSKQNVDKIIECVNKFS
jgi:dTDP-4-amino-4,6-dideoxygalactose transaminase